VLRLIFAAGCTTGDTIGCLNFTSLFHVYVMYCMNCFFIGNAVRAAFLCEHVRLSRVAYNKLTYSLTYLQRAGRNVLKIHIIKK